jgi:hypothetical protein
MRRRVIIGLLVVVIGIVVALLKVEFSTETSFVSPYTGSRRIDRERFFGLIGTVDRSQVSGLELFLRRNYPQDLKGRWISWKKVGKNIFGGTVSSNQWVGPFADLTIAELDGYTARLSGDEKKELYDYLSTTNSYWVNKRVEEILATIRTPVTNK